MKEILNTTIKKRVFDLFKRNNFLNLKLLIWLLLIYFPLFLNLGGVCIQKWDESRYGDSSYEMLHGGNPFVVTYFNQPSMDSVKPPLLHWLQAICIAFFGFNETSVRLPSALAGLIVCLAIMRFSLRRFNSFSFGAIASIALLCTVAPAGFCGLDHSARSADYDSMLTLFSFLGLICFYWYNEEPGRNKYLFYTFLFIMLAVLTKGVAGLFFLPGLFIYAIIRKNFLPLFKNKWFYLSAALFTGVIAFVLLMREYYTPGYLKALNEWEIMGRHSTVMDGHVGEFWFYLQHLKTRFDTFFWFILLGWLFGLSSADQKIRRFSLFSFVLCTSFFLALSSAQSKLTWYSLPMFPLLALQGALFVWIVLKHLADLFSRKTPTNRIALYYLSVVLMFAAPYTVVVADANENSHAQALEVYNNLQKYLKFEHEVVRNGILISTPRDTEGQYLFYFYKLNDRGFNLKYNRVPGEYKKGDKLIVEDPVIQEVIEKNYLVKVIDELTHLKVYLVLDKKPV